ncbi:hypothetical protein MTR67_005407 [Solanum verrucosum]|uniref:Uncharacterized protein n=2 Tax=Solanum TaxID=4107 RepID=A0ABQ7WUZ9_SOLTU|nr:hypothetical protein KY290_004162 [Solanum tuberosum]WMV12022.1 hypothetical protein MTR67_005407 [Solanum verrucosum]
MKRRSRRFSVAFRRTVYVQYKEPPSALHCYPIKPRNTPPNLFIGNGRRYGNVFFDENYNLVPEFPSWNRLLHHFNSSGLVDQEKVKEFVAEQVQESEEGISTDCIVSGAFMKIVGKEQEFCYG